jgi:hypothetical protein
LDVAASHTAIQTRLDVLIQGNFVTEEPQLKMFVEVHKQMPREQRVELISETFLKWTEFAEALVHMRLWYGGPLSLRDEAVKGLVKETSERRDHFQRELDVRRTIAHNAVPPTNCLLPPGF